VVQEDAGVIEAYPDGRMMQGLNVAMSDEDVEATRQGYKCIRCFENLENAWPRACPVCNFPIGTHQAEMFEQVYKGHDPTARTSADWEREADMMLERSERRLHTATRAKESGISLVGASVGKALDRMKGKS
jgi:hypothetical protein